MDPTASTQTLQLLLVEDHQMTRMGLRMLLEKSNRFAIVGEAGTGTQAVRVAGDTLPDVVLMDIGLPEMDGIEATQKIKAQWPNTRILMLTSKDDERDVLAALAAGADGYCMKGISPESLEAAIIAIADGAAWLDPGIARIVLGRFAGQTVESLSQANKAGEAALVTPAGPPADCPLTPRELEVLKLIVDGHSNPEIADVLVITKATAKAHVHSILQKLCVDDRTQAAVLAMRQNYFGG